MSKKVLFIAYQIPPIGGSAVQRHLRFLSRLPGCGWIPFILTVNPADCEDYFPKDESLNSLLPPELAIVHARSFNPMDRLLVLKALILAKLNIGSSGHSKEIHGVLPGASDNANGIVRSIKDLLTEIFRIPDRQIGWLPFATRKGLKIIKNEGIDIIYSSGNPWTSHLIGRKLAKRTGLPWVADFRDPWVLNSYKSRRFHFIETIEKRLEQIVVEDATAVVANTKALKEQFLSSYPQLPLNKVVHIGNGYNGDLFKGLINFNGDKRFVVSHVGSLYANRSPLSLLDAVAKLKQKGLLSKSNFVLRFIGTVSVPGVGPDLTAKKNIDDIVQFCPPVSHSQALQELVDSDVLLIIQPATKLQIPAKIFEYIAVGKPIFAITGKGATADLVKDERLGIVANPDNSDEIAEKLLSMIQMYSNGALQGIPQATRAKFESLPLTLKLANLFENCVGRKNRQ